MYVYKMVVYDVLTIPGPDGQFYRKPIVYRGRDAVEHFLMALLEEERVIFSILKKVEPMTFTAADSEEFEASSSCHI